MNHDSFRISFNWCDLLKFSVSSLTYSTNFLSEHGHSSSINSDLHFDPGPPESKLVMEPCLEDLVEFLREKASVNPLKSRKSLTPAEAGLEDLLFPFPLGATSATSSSGVIRSSLTS